MRGWKDCWTRLWSNFDLFPVVSPTLLNTRPLRSVRDLHDHVLLHGDDGRARRSARYHEPDPATHAPTFTLPPPPLPRALRPMAGGRRRPAAGDCTASSPIGVWTRALPGGSSLTTFASETSTFAGVTR